MSRERAARRDRVTLGASGAILFALVVALGVAVSSHPTNALDRAGAGLFGEATPLAVFASESGLFPVYLGLAVAALVVGIARRALFAKAVFLAVALLLTWQTSDAVKVAFARVRPTHWLWVHERSASYPSGHAALAIAGYGTLAGIVWTSRLPLRERRVIAGALVAWIVVIDWSRLALGAHWLTDVLGGTLLGLAVVRLLRAVADPFAKR